MAREKLWGWVLLFLLLSPARNDAWDNEGHETVAAVAFLLNPKLEPRVKAVLKDMPKSGQWRVLKASGLKPNNPFETEKSDPDGWVRSLANKPERAATFADWARDYRDYIPSHYDKIHYYNMDYDDPANTRFVGHPNALTALPGLEKALRTWDKGDRAWALAWILHIVGDLHQPLHCVARGLPGSPNRSDSGGNGVNYRGVSLHSYWDHLPDRLAKPSPTIYAQALVLASKNFNDQKRAAFEAKVKDLNPEHWIREGRDLIFEIGYPADNKVTDYDAKARSIADAQILLAGARLAKILESALGVN